MTWDRKTDRLLEGREIDEGRERRERGEISSGFRGVKVKGGMDSRVFEWNTRRELHVNYV